MDGTDHLEANAAGHASVRERDVVIPVGPVRLPGTLAMAEPTSGLVLFAHGSGSSRHSPRNRAVAADLHPAGLGTLLFDLLTPDESLDRANVFDIELLGGRLAAATRWLRTQADAAALPMGYFGASTGGGAALWAAAELPDEAGAVVSRGGRPDLAGSRLAEVTVPSLLIVGGRDDVVLKLNAEALELLRGQAELVVVDGATHLFEEPGAMEQVSALARDWFVRHLDALPS